MMIAKFFRYTALALFCCTQFSYGQNPKLSVDQNFHSPLFTKKLPNTPRLAVFDDQKAMLFGLTFDVLNGVKRGPLIRLNAGGTVDESFALGIDPQSVRAVARQSDGKYVIAVYGSSYKTGTYFELYRISDSGVLDNAFLHTARPDGDIRAITITDDAKLLVGGLFTTWNGETYPGIVRLNTDGSIDHSFKALALELNEFSDFPAGVWARPKIDSQGRIVIVGNFTDINGISLPRVARLLPDGTVDPTFAPSGFTREGGFPIRGLAIQGDAIFIGGRFNAFDKIRPVLKLDSSGQVDAAFQTELTGTAIRDLTANSTQIFGVADRVYGWNSSGQVLPGFPTEEGDPGSGADTIFTITSQADGKLVIGGDFTTIGATPREGIARINPDGTLDNFASGNLELETLPSKVALQSSGKIILAGDFEKINGVPQSTLSRLNTSGSLDSSFIADVPAVQVTDLQVQADDKILVAQNGGPALSRLLPNGAIDSSFNPSATVESVSKIIVADNGIYVAAANDAQDIFNQQNHFIRRLGLTGAEDSGFQFSFDPNLVTTDPNLPFAYVIFSPGPQPIHVFSDGKILVQIYVPRTGFQILRFNSDATQDTSFATGTIPRFHGEDEIPDNIIGTDGQPKDVLLVRAVDRGVTDAVELPNKQILLSGDFQTYNGAIVRGLVALNDDGTPSSSFQLGAGAQWSAPVPRDARPAIENMELLADGNILLTGNFELLNGASAKGIAVISPTGQPLSNDSSLQLFNDGPVQPFPRSQLVENAAGDLALLGRYGIAGPQALVRLSSSNSAPPVRLTIVQSGEELTLELSGDSTRDRFVDASADLKTWDNLQTVPAGASAFNLSISGGARFFRAHY
jgi:uncharacterized delta-60 repeat protein